MKEATLLREMMKRPMGQVCVLSHRSGDAETFDAATGKSYPTPRRMDFSTLRDVRLELAVVYRKMDAGEIESQD
jgi:hypothetical protein